jgi:hypothetical protein
MATHTEAALFDAQGCLSPRGFARISAAPPGQVPAELAVHLAGCMRCQRRLLAAAMPSSGSTRRERPPLWRTGVAVVVCVLLVMMAMMLMQFLNTPPR